MLYGAPPERPSPKALNIEARATLPRVVLVRDDRGANPNALQSRHRETAGRGMRSESDELLDLASFQTLSALMITMIEPRQT